ncbi:hypothetical protein HSB1_14890 [Halogranum salarium B-1]|uniref:Uncharacterized protein n=1 Tax=Halogranum salarium B-1 TaxID=1210908 RepID=J3JHD3_9EURY|nr:hypothetical protein HSB1_14890 [Halogranum salarium B-1]
MEFDTVSLSVSRFDYPVRRLTLFAWLRPWNYHILYVFRISSLLPS